MKIRLQNELLLVNILVILLIIVIILSPSNILRIILGLPFVLFFPGYTLIAALFPRKSALDGIERLALSFGLSIAMVPLIGLLLNYWWAITLYPFLISVTVFTFAMSAIAWCRRRRLPEGEEFSIAFNLSLFPGQGQNLIDKSLSIFLVVAMLGAIGTSVYTATKSVEGYTEFDTLGAGGKAENYPQKLLAGEEGKVFLVVVNHERMEVNYQIEAAIEDGGVYIDGKEQYEINVTLDDGEKWQGEIRFTFNTVGDDQKLKFILYKDNEPEPYLKLHLWIDIYTRGTKNNE